MRKKDTQESFQEMFFQEGVTDVMFAVQEITTRLGDEEVITVNVNKFS